MKNLKRYTVRDLLLPSLLLAGVLLGGLVLKASAEEAVSLKDQVAKIIAEYAKENRDANVAGKIADWLLGSKAEEGEAFGSSYVRNENRATRLGNEVCWFEVGEETQGTLCRGVIILPLTIDSNATSSYSVRNDFAEPIFVDRATITKSGTVSSTILETVTTSTVPAVAYNSNVSGAIIDKYRTVTSTVGTLFPVTSGYGPTFSPYGSATGTSKVVPWEQGTYLLYHVKAEDPLVSVTSTAWRGYTDSKLWIEYTRFTTSSKF